MNLHAQLRRLENMITPVDAKPNRKSYIVSSSEEVAAIRLREPAAFIIRLVGVQPDPMRWANLAFT